MLSVRGVVLTALISCIASASAERITNLPGWNYSNFNQYSGYITVSASHGRALFYWFTEAEKNAATAPIVIWLNGGPGCSSVGGGAMSELGPFYPTANGDLTPNTYSWNTVANMIFVESPAGVGFSYSNTSSDYIVGDKRTSEDLYTFLQGFLQEFPQYKYNQVYIAGESYGGHYVPNFANTIVEKNKLGTEPHINFQGFMVGNAWTDAEIDNTGAAFYWWTHGLIYDDAFYGILHQCNTSNIGPLKESKMLRTAYAGLEAALNAGERFDRGNCNYYQNLATTQMGNINIYDVYVDVCSTGSDDDAPSDSTPRNDAAQLLKHLSAARQEENSSMKPGYGLLRGHRNLAGPDNNDGGSANYDPCISSKVSTYLNRADVQNAIHARNLGYPWRDCSNIVQYSRKDLLTSMLPVYRNLLKSGIRMMVFSGDVDAIVPITGTRAWLDVLDLPVKHEWRSYTVDGQVGGYTLEYEGLTFTSVRNAGHMVPYTQRSRALHIFKQFLAGQPM